MRRGWRGKKRGGGGGGKGKGKGSVGGREGELVGGGKHIAI